MALLEADVNFTVVKKFINSVTERAAVALGMMLVGALGMKIVPAEYFGVVERFSVFAATGFNAALGLHLFLSGRAGGAE